MWLHWPCCAELRRRLASVLWRAAACCGVLRPAVGCCDVLCHAATAGACCGVLWRAYRTRLSKKKRRCSTQQEASNRPTASIPCARRASLHAAHPYKHTHTFTHTSAKAFTNTPAIHSHSVLYSVLTFTHHHAIAPTHWNSDISSRTGYLQSRSP